MTDLRTRYPGIVKATLEMSYDNGGIYSGHGVLPTRTEEDVLIALEGVLGAEGVYEDDLQKIDAWLLTLSEDDLQTAVAGEETEMKVLTDKSPDPAKTEGLLNDIFDNAA